MNNVGAVTAILAGLKSGAQIAKSAERIAKRGERIANKFSKKHSDSAIDNGNNKKKLKIIAGIGAVAAAVLGGGALYLKYKK